MTHPEYAIQARGVARRYGTMQALAGVDMDVRRGEIFAVLGPNGAGKTTFIEILEGLRRRDAGTVNVLGEDPSDGRRSWRARIGAVLQLGTETDELTVREMVEAFAAYYPNPLSATELFEALDLTGAARSQSATALRGSTTSTRSRPRHDRQPGAAIPRRAHHRTRSGSAEADLAVRDHAR